MNARVEMESQSVGSEERSLWTAYRMLSSAPAKQRLLALYEPLARTIAARLYKARIDDSVPFADYLQYGRVGLIEALERYELSREVPFAAYSSPRIRGSILNGIAKESEYASQRHFWSDRWEERVGSLRTAVAPAADRASLAEVVTITMGLAVGVLAEGVDPEREPADPAPYNDPYTHNELRQLASAITGLIARLPEREREVIHAHYAEHIEFRVLAERLGITKGRISQLHAQALLRLRAWLEERPRVDRKL